MDAVRFHRLSFTDYNGRLFQWQGQLYRAIPKDQAALYQVLFERGIVQELIDQRLLVDTQLTPFTLNGDLVLQHHVIRFVSYPQEWCSAMLKDAALLHLDLCLALDRHDLTTDDAHPINLLFEGSQPLFVDFGSINRLPNDGRYPWPWPPYGQFCNTFLYPLLLMAQGQPGYRRLARWLMHDYELGVLQTDLEALIEPWPGFGFTRTTLRRLEAAAQHHLPPRTKRLVQRAYWLFNAIRKPRNLQRSRRDFLQQLRDQVLRINVLAGFMQGEMGQSNGLVGAVSQIDWPAEIQTLDRVLADVQPESVLNVSSPAQVVSSTLIAALFSPVVVLSPNEGVVQQLYLQAKAEQLPILPLLFDLYSPSYGLSNDWYAPASERLCCELVLAWDLALSLLLECGFDFIVSRLAQFTRRWLLIDFRPQPSPSLATRWEERSLDCSWYTLDNFRAALGQFFSRVRTISPASEPCSAHSRVWLLCEK